MPDPLGKATTSLEDKRRANSASTGLSVLVFMMQARTPLFPVPAVCLPFSQAPKSVGDSVQNATLVISLQCFGCIGLDFSYFNSRTQSEV